MVVNRSLFVIIILIKNANSLTNVPELSSVPGVLTIPTVLNNQD